MILFRYIVDKYMIILNFISVQKTFYTCIPQGNYLFLPQLPVYSFEVDSIIWHSCEIHENLRLLPGDNTNADYRWRYHLTTKNKKTRVTNSSDSFLSITLQESAFKIPLLGNAAERSLEETKRAEMNATFTSNDNTKRNYYARLTFESILMRGTGNVVRHFYWKGTSKSVNSLPFEFLSDGSHK